MKFSLSAVSCLATVACWATSPSSSPFTVMAVAFDDETTPASSTNAIRGMKKIGPKDADGKPGGKPGKAGAGGRQQDDDDLAGENRGPFQIGSHHKIRISSNGRVSQIKPQRIQSATARQPSMQRYTLSHPGASYLAVHFAEMDCPTTCTMVISNGMEDDLDKTIMTGKGRHNLGNFWARHVQGDTMLITMECMGDGDTNARFEIDDYVAGYPNEATEEGRRRVLEAFYDDFGMSPTEDLDLDNNPFVKFHHDRHLSQCGVNDKTNAICFKDSHPTEYEKAKAVARLYINGSGACTGWLVGENPSLLLTNEHCIASQSDVLNTDFEFMGEEDSCASTAGDSWMGARGDIYNGASLLKVNAAKDYALIQLEEDPAAEYGFLELDNREAVEDELIYIPQHPGGRAKELGIVDTNEAGGVCRVLGMKGRCGASGEDVGYTCDTEGGSSGSPVLAQSSHKAIALHHCGGGCNGNVGVPINDIYEEIEGYLGGPAPPTPTPPPPTPCTGSTLTVEVMTDWYPAETSWTVTKEGSVVDQSSAYTSTETFYTDSMCLQNGEYEFEIADTWGDGICCGYGQGSYELVVDGTAIPTATTGAFTTSEVTSFTIDKSPQPPTSPPHKSPQPPTSPPLTMSSDWNWAENKYIGEGVMFDLVAKNSLNVLSFDINQYSSLVTYEIWTKPGSCQGFENNQAAWTKIGTAANVETNGYMQRTPIPTEAFSPVYVAADATQAFYVTVLTNERIVYNKDSSVALGDVFAEDANVALLANYAKKYLFSSSWSPRFADVDVTYSLLNGGEIYEDNGKGNSEEEDEYETNLDDGNGIDYGELHEEEDEGELDENNLNVREGDMGV